MGTRHLVCVKLNGDYKVSQFGNMGGQPQAAGVGCLKHLKEILLDLNGFKDKLDLVELVVYDENAPYNEEIEIVIPAYNVLDIIKKANTTIKFYPSLEYAGDSSCDWVYVIDLDSHKLKVYKGNNKDSDKEAKEFSQFVPVKERNLGFRAVTLLNEYDLNQLPDSQVFIDYYDKLEQNEEDM